MLLYVTNVAQSREQGHEGALPPHHAAKFSWYSSKDTTTTVVDCGDDQCSTSWLSTWPAGTRIVFFHVPRARCFDRRVRVEGSLDIYICATTLAWCVIAKKVDSVRFQASHARCSTAYGTVLYLKS